MEEYGSYNWNQQGNEPQNNTPMEPKKQPGKRNGNGARSEPDGQRKSVQ